MADPDKRGRREVWLERERVRERFEADARRVERQRTLFVMLPPGHAKEALLKAMLARAEDLLIAGRADEADAVLEFVPSADASRFLDRLLPNDEARADG